MNELALIKGIGPYKMKRLSELNINNNYDLATYYPFRYNYIKKTDLFAEKVIVAAEVVSVPYKLKYK